MTSSTTPTAYAVSPDSGEHWTAEGAWQVAEGIHRIPLPLPMDGLKAINVYVITTDTGLVLIDGGWAIPEARELLDRCLRTIGSGFGDIRRFLVTHVHRDHYTLARVLGAELGVDVALGRGDEPALAALNDLDRLTENPFAGLLRTAGAHDIADLWNSEIGGAKRPDPELWHYPTRGSRVTTRSRSARAPSTPYTRPVTRRATSSSPTVATGCCSPATTCCRRSRRPSGSRSRPRLSRSATSWHR